MALLSYSDEHARIIRGAVDLELFEGHYKTIAGRIYDHLDKHKTAPKDHLRELFEKELLKTKDDKAKRTAGLYRELLQAIRNSYKDVNAGYVMNRLEKFIRHQQIKKATLEVAEVMQKGAVDDDTIGRAEAIFTGAMRRKLGIFDPGTFLGNTPRALRFLDDQEQDVFRLGVDELDKANLGPKRKTLLLFIGLPKHGKTWFLVNLGKEALIDGYKVCHISLEMSEERISKRYHQALFAIAQHRPEKDFSKTKIVLSAEDGSLRRLKEARFSPKHAYDDKGIYKYLVRRRRKIEKRLDRILIKDFPTGQLTLRQLETYLDNMELYHSFVPDLLLVDYPQLMQLPLDNYRLALGKITQGIRGLAVERNLAAVVVSQSGRKALRSGGERKMKVISAEHIAEDFSQIMTADTVLTYNQTNAERDLGLARIHVADARDEEARFTVLISQHYPTGQFALRSVRMNEEASKLLKERLGHGDDEDKDYE